MAVTIDPLRRRYQPRAIGPTPLHGWAVPILSLRPGDTFEAASAFVTAFSGSLNVQQPHEAHQVLIFFQWAFATPPDSPNVPVEPFPTPDDTPAVNSLTYQDAVVATDDMTWYVKGSIKTNETRFTATQNALLMVCLSHDFGVGQVMSTWDGDITSMSWYRAPSERLPF